MRIARQVDRARRVARPVVEALDTVGRAAPALGSPPRRATPATVGALAGEHRAHGTGVARDRGGVLRQRIGLRVEEHELAAELVLVDLDAARDALAARLDA